MYIYIHIPFCNNICKYCDFPKLLYDKKYVSKYLDILESEITSRYKGEIVKTIYIGGGTPTSLDYSELQRLLDITKIFNRTDKIEFTIESNIEGLDIDKIQILHNNGINRVSLGVQSFDDDTLLELNRKHTKEMVFEVVKNIKDAGIDNISIDYIYGVNEDIEELKRGINSFLELDIPHISCYSLIIEDNTVFSINNREYIDQDKDLEMYKYIKNKLAKHGYNHYEISNYGRDGYKSIHNLNYWNNGYYYGFGMGSVSYLNNYRISNTKNLSRYMKGEYLDSSVYEDIDTRISNTIILGLRKIDGIDINEFNNRFDASLLDLYNIRELIKDGKLVVRDNRLFISLEYIYMANDILINFI